MGGCHIILRRRRSAGYNGQHCPKDRPSPQYRPMKYQRMQLPIVSNTLYGLLPGLSVMQQTGWTDDAATLLRGYNNPLIVVDGFARPLSYLNTAEIESVTVLKRRCRNCRVGNTGSKRCDSDYHQKRRVQHQNANRCQL